MSAPIPEDLSETLKRLAISLVDSGQTRFELLRVELAEERARIGSFLYHGAALAFLAFQTLELLVLAIIGMFWDGPYRFHVVGVMVGLSFLVTFCVWVSMRLRQTRHAEMLVGLATELGKDRAALESIG